MCSLYLLKDFKGMTRSTYVPRTLTALDSAPLAQSRVGKQCFRLKGRFQISSFLQDSQKAAIILFRSMILPPPFLTFLGAILMLHFPIVYNPPSPVAVVTDLLVSFSAKSQLVLVSTPWRGEEKGPSFLVKRALRAQEKSWF